MMNLALHPPRRLRAAVFILVLAACAEPPEPSQAPQEGVDTVTVDTIAEEQSAPAPEDGTVARWRARLPEGALVRRGACPFECCVYREWMAESRIPVVPAPESSATASFHLEPGTAFQADSGFVRVTEIALVAVTEPVIPIPQRRLEPGDTLVLLDYVGEGFHNAWLDGEFVEVSDFWSSATGEPRGEVIGEHRSEWWVHATAGQGSSGWFRADAEGVEIAGADACGGPV